MVRTRFAPSPTGFMHVGNLRTALYSYLLAKSQEGTFVLRIEDTDQARQVDKAVEGIHATLQQANLRYDEGPDVGGDFGPYVQSARLAIYREHAAELARRGAAYYCFCDKIEQDAEDVQTGGYGGNCRSLDPAVVAANLAAGLPHVIRQRIDRAGVTSFTDLVFGDIMIENKVLDDQILIKRDGMPTYNFANVVDDHLMHITHVVRGSEYLSSTPKYNLLYGAFGWPIPQYVHLPLIMGKNPDGTVTKLSKRHGAVSFEQLIEEGYLAEAVVNSIALLGWSPKNDREIFSHDELIALFKISGLNKAPAIFDYEKLKWVNSQQIKAMAPDEFASRAFAFSGITKPELAACWGNLIAPLLQQRIELLTEIPDKIAFLAELPEYPAAFFHNKNCKCDPDRALAILKDLKPLHMQLGAWTAPALADVIRRYAERCELKLGLPMWALRIAVSGQLVTPGGPPEIMEILGRDESFRRIDRAIDLLSIT